MQNNTYLIDSHCHLNCLDLTPYNGHLQAAIEASIDNNIKQILTAGVTLEEMPELLSIANQYHHITCSVGVHPTEENCAPPTIEQLIEIGKDQKVVGVGETGLDYHWPGDYQQQKEWFRIHIAAAKQLKKPLIIHARECFPDILEIIREEKADEIGGVFHCFTGDWKEAQEILDLGFFIGISGIVTFKKATQVQEVAVKMPINKMLLETDAPYLAPVPMRGKPNEPSFLRHTAEFVAKLRNITLNELAEQTSNNFHSLFR